jgi:hypothetical protein
MLYIDWYAWENKVRHNLAVMAMMKEYIDRSGAYVGPDDPDLPDDRSNENYYLPKVSEEVQMELTEARRFLMMAYVYELRFMKLKSGEDDQEDFLRLLRQQLEEVGYPKCNACGIRELPDYYGGCRYCGHIN